MPTGNASAYEYYLSGLEYQRRSDLESLSFAARQYQRSVDEDPEFALAWSRLARAHLALYWSLEDHSDSRLAMAHAAVERALELQPDLPEAHLAKARDCSARLSNSG